MRRKPRLRIRGVAMTKGSVEKGGKTYEFTEAQLKGIADKLVGLPMLHEHRGRSLGKVEKAWYEEGKVYIEAILYEPENEKEEVIIRRVETGELTGLSPSLTLTEMPEKVVLHGSLRVVDEKEDGTLIVEGRIPKEEIHQKLGSAEALRHYKITSTWIHDGSALSKKRIEESLD